MINFPHFKAMKKRIFGIIVWLSYFCISAQAQHKEECLFHAGIANALIGGIYEGIYPCGKIKEQGDFGIGAPANLDGELSILDGKIYQTRFTGETSQPADTSLASFATVHFFKADTVFNTPQNFSKSAFYAWLDSLFPDKTAMLAIKVKGHFEMVKTRAFPPSYEHPAPPLASILDRQHFFDFKHSQGTFVGYRLPAYLKIWSIPGYHFHWLPDDLMGGGHVVDFVAEGVQVEVDFIPCFSVWIPSTVAYKAFDLEMDLEQSVKKVEEGK